MKSHTQVKAVVAGETVTVDQGVKSLVDALNRVRGVTTLNSCEGDRGVEYGGDGYVMFAYAFKPERLQKMLKGWADTMPKLTVHMEWGAPPVSGETELTGTIRFPASALKRVTEEMRRLTVETKR